MDVTIIMDFIKEVFEDVDKAHDFDHCIRVYKNALNIMSSIQCVNAEVVILSALLHDVSDQKLFSSQKHLDKWFTKYPSEFEFEIRKVISEVSFSSQKKPSSIEAKIVQDADRLDAIGAIGIARVFTYGGHIDRPIYSESSESSFSHFYNKLFKIKELLNTEKAKSIAEVREKYMRDFILVFADELEGKR